MNGTERAYADLLEQNKRRGEIEWWVFDAIKLRLAENTFYTPDFLVQANDDALEVHEVKGGFIRDDAIVKLKVAAVLYPFRFFLCVYKNKKTGWKISQIGGEEQDS